MPSSAFSFFEKKLLTDVDRLIESHSTLSHGGRGKHGLGHITRSGVVLLCAAWESYVEKLALESMDKLLERADSPQKLPKNMQKFVVQRIKGNPNELYAMRLSGDGWRRVFKNEGESIIENFNTPKPGRLEELFRRLVGVEELWKDWSQVEIDELNDFVCMRGAIAHNGSDATYVKIQQLQCHRLKIPEIAIQLDNQMADYIVALFPKPDRAPWRRRL